ncbi:MAG: tRNA (adenosine(37)-N6)-threonylcarbamoyltransferase complex dimerization subunit type 1 TsaB, partial [Lachnospiraceae bacterium]|nr:tRNA (adenosine(37)-N6)-threonylcarbamoyltransferase complex dimerization subunit type 1 TsaB [Lachnospiraceae bacterium]
PYEYALANNNKQRASSVAVLGEIMFKEGKDELASEHKPDYLRLSQAERERQEKERDFKIC